MADRLLAQSLPSPWKSIDVGDPATAGRAASWAGTFTVEASGADIWGKSDEFHFVYQPIKGDVEIIARVDAVAKTDDWSKAGVMIRASLKADSAHAFALVSAGKGLAVDSRTANRGKSERLAGDSLSAPQWVRLVRAGKTITAYHSNNGTSWTRAATVDVALGKEAYVGLAVTSRAASALTSATFSNIQVLAGSDSPPLPDGLSSADIGEPTARGRATHEKGTFRVSGAGTDIWNSQDQFHYVYRPVTGDMDVRVRVAGIQHVHAESKAGVMIRESLDPDSRHAMALVSAGKGARFQRRVNAGADSKQTGGGSKGAPAWVRLVRAGTTIEAFRSSDGESWSSIGSDVIPMAETVYVGLAVTSRLTGTLADGVFDNLSIATLDQPNQSPSVAITTPWDGTTLIAPANVRMTVSALDPDGEVARVEFFAGNFRIGSSTTLPYSLTWPAEPGVHALSAIAYDGSGASTRSDTVTVTVLPEPGPVIILTSPLNGATFAAPATMTLSAGTPDVWSRFGRVDFFANGILIGSDSSSPYSFKWKKVPAGRYDITAVGYDALTGKASAPSTSSVTVKAGGGGPPTPSPTLVVFESSADHKKVKRYVLEIFPEGANPGTAKALVTSDLGKPKPDGRDEISVDRSELFEALAGGSYVVTVRAENKSGFNRSAPVTFTR